MASVPCNGCTACCRNELLFLHPEMGDRPEDYQVKPAMNPITGKAGYALAQKPNGDCIYLGETGCTIHSRAPAICKEFDCRRFFLRLGSRNERRQLLKTGLVAKEVYEAGRKRLPTLPERAA
ncbi:MAG: YkgJ family cysteine cluster protein [Mesorhizobium sp.]